MARIVVVEDADAIAELLEDHLKDLGHEVTRVGDGQHAIDHMADGLPELVVLDVMLPTRSGIEVCRWIRAQRGTQPVVLMLTARREESDVLDGYDAGADDYVRKPFSTREVLRRVAALLALAARTGDRPTGAAVVVGALRVDPSSRRVDVGDSTVDVAPMEFDLLLRLARSPGEVLNRATLLRDVWGYHHSGYARTVDSHVTRLRRKLAAAGLEDSIQTCRGVGYSLERTPS